MQEAEEATPEADRHGCVHTRHLRGDGGLGAEEATRQHRVEAPAVELARVEQRACRAAHGHQRVDGGGERQLFSVHTKARTPHARRAIGPAEVRVPDGQELGAGFLEGARP